jgi:hypothetical protein
MDTLEPKDWQAAQRNPVNWGRSTRMSWILPAPMLLFAGTVALWSLAAVMRRPTSSPRLLVEALGVTLAVIALVQLAWIALWLIERRW